MNRKRRPQRFADGGSPQFQNTNPQMPPAGIDFNNLPGTSTVNPLSGFIDVTRLPGVDDNESISGTSNSTPPIDVAYGAKPQIQDTGTTYRASNQATTTPADLTVADLYASLLGRTPDAAGLAYWNQTFGDTVDPTELQAFQQAAAPELQQRATDPRAYLQSLQDANASLLNIANAPAALNPLDTLYRGYGGRAPDEPGSQYWGNQLGNVFSPAEMREFEQVIRAAEGQPSAPQTFTGPMADQISGLYQEYLGRSPESQAAIDYWTSTLGSDAIDELDRQRFSAVAQTELDQRKGRIGPSVAEQLFNINEMIAMPQIGVADKRGDAAGETYALNQQALNLDKFRIALRGAYDDPQSLSDLEQQIQSSSLDDNNKRVALEYLNDAKARIGANNDVMTGDYVNEYARSLDRMFGGALTPNQANILSRDYTPAEATEALRAFAISNGKMLPEDALRAAREFNDEDSANIAKSYRWSQSSQGQPGTLGGTLNFREAFSRYDPEKNTFVGAGAKPEKDVFAAQFNANLGLGDRLPTAEGLNPVGEGFFTRRLGNPGAYDLYAVYATDPKNGELVQVGTSTNFKPELSGFKKFLSSPLGQIVLGIGTSFIAPGLGSALGSAFGSQVAGKIAANAVLGGLRSELSGGSFGKGALGGGLGAVAGHYVGGLDAVKGLSPELASGITRGAANLVNTGIMSDFDLLSTLAAGAAPVVGGATQSAKFLPTDISNRALGSGAAAATDALIRSGGNVNAALQIGAATGLGAYAAPTITGGLNQYLPEGFSNMLGAAGANAIASQIMGGDPAQAATMGAVGSVVNPFLQRAANSLYGSGR